MTADYADSPATNAPVQISANRFLFYFALLASAIACITVLSFMCNVVSNAVNYFLVCLGRSRGDREKSTGKSSSAELQLSY